MKRCTRCHQIKSLPAFRQSKVHANGRYSQCLQCESDYRRSPTRRIAHNIWKRRKRNSDVSRASERRHANKYRLKYPEKRRAQRRVHTALRNGSLVRPERCENCGNIPQPRLDGRSGIQAHHHKGYEYPLDVQWLCVMCHSAADRARQGKVKP